MSLKDYINNAINEHRRAIQSGLTYFGTQQEDNKLWSLIDKVWNFAWDTEVRLAALEKAAKPVEENPYAGIKTLTQFDGYWVCYCGKKFPGKASDYRDYLCDCDKPSKEANRSGEAKPKKKIVVSGFCYSDSSGKWYVLKEHKKFCDFSVVFRGYKSVEIEFKEGEFDE